MKRYRLYGEVLTPIHIGSGVVIEPYEYMISEDRLYKIDLAELLISLEDTEREEILGLLEKDILGFRGFIRNRVDLSRYSQFSVGVSPEVSRLYKDKLVEFQNQLLIGLFIRSLNQPYIPGSSLKGALRTAVIFHLLSGKTGEGFSDRLEGNILGCLDNRGFLNPSSDPFRAIKIRDASLEKDSTAIEEIETFRNDGDRLKDMGMQVIKEVVSPKTSFETELLIDDDLFRKNRDMGRRLNTEIFINACSDFYQQVIDRERDYFKETEVASNYERFLQLDKGEFLLRLGWGSGFNSTTVNLKMFKPKQIRTRKLVDGHLPLGWIKAKIAPV
ncbi:MAG: type III-A CRISPR-associated RAMP protein Csm5 [bacterium]